MQRRRFIQGALGAAAAGALPASVWAAATQALTEVTDPVNAVTGDRKPASIERAAIAELRDSLRGRLLLPGQEGYEAARRVLNAGIDRHPAMVVQPSGPADVMRAIDFARERKLLVAVKCGGHSWGGKSTCEGGMQIDLSRMRHCRVDPRARRARVSGGSLLGELDHECMAHGLVTTAGTVSHTGVGGLTLGGGFGRVARRFGLALDNVTAVEIVTADGKLVRASADSHPDLYWAVRGGGGNFGVVTEFEFALHPMQRNIVGGDIVFPIAQLRQVLAFYADYLPQAPDELYLDLIIASRLGSPDAMVAMHACWSGPEDQAEAALAPLRKAGTPVVDGFKRMDYTAIQRMHDNSDPRNTNEYVKSGFVNTIPGTLVDAIVENYRAFEERSSVLLFQCSGGAIGRIAGDATAFAQRASLANMMSFIEWPLSDDPAPHVAYVREHWKALEPFTDGWYSNEVSSESARVVNSNYGANYPRLAEVKKRYDPGNLFRLNANITPEA